jgi:CRP-like cAMP-binding protein
MPPYGLRLGCEMALIEDVPRSATVRATTPTSVLAIDREQFLALVRRLPRLRSAFGSTIQSRHAADRALLSESPSRPI